MTDRRNRWNTRVTALKTFSQMLTFRLTYNLTLGYYQGMEKTSHSAQASNAAKELARLSVQARREKWGEKEFVRKMQAWGKLGGRPPKESKGDK